MKFYYNDAFEALNDQLRIVENLWNIIYLLKI